MAQNNTNFIPHISDCQNQGVTPFEISMGGVCVCVYVESVDEAKY